MEVKVDKVFLNGVLSDEINSLDLRTDLENDNISNCILIPQGYVGNRPSTFIGEHEDDSWAIDVMGEEGECFTSYLYTSEFEYKEDVKLIKPFA